MDFSQIEEAKNALILAGGLVVGVYAAIMAIDKVKLVLIVRQSDREYMQSQAERT